MKPELIAYEEAVDTLRILRLRVLLEHAALHKVHCPVCRALPTTHCLYGPYSYQGLERNNNHPERLALAALLVG